MMQALRRQTRQVDHLVVVDNGSSPETVAIVEDTAATVTVLTPPSNVGPAGGFAFGLEHVIATARDEDLVVLLDDDDPPPELDLFERLEQFISAQPSSVAGVGANGARLGRAGRLIRVPDNELANVIDVDVIGGRAHGIYRVGVIKATGVHDVDLFFGFEELEFCLRMRDAGFRLVVLGALTLQRRQRTGRLGLKKRRSLAASQPAWRRYYSVRNMIVILRRRGRRRAALSMTITAGLAKPLLHTLLRPRTGLAVLALHIRAVRDGWTDRLGCTVEPDGEPS